MSEAPKWIEKAKATYKFHRDKLVAHPHWKLSDSAKALKRSIGSISEDLLIVRWLKSHEKQMEKIPTAKEVLEYIREKKKMQDMDEVD